LQLREKWLVFQKNSPKEDRVDLQRFSPSMESVVQMVNEMSSIWRKKSSKWQKVSRFFTKVGRTLHAHKALLEVLPQGSEYVSVFTGSLTALVKVRASPLRRRNQGMDKESMI